MTEAAARRRSGLTRAGIAAAGWLQRSRRDRRKAERQDPDRGDPRRFRGNPREREPGRETYAGSSRRTNGRLCERFSGTPLRHSTSPVLARVGRDETADSITLTNGVTIAAYPCRPQRFVGSSVCCRRRRVGVLPIERRPPDRRRNATGAASDACDHGRQADRAVARTGRRAHCGIFTAGNTAATTRRLLVWQASAPEMNPTLAADYLASHARRRSRGVPLRSARRIPRGRLDVLRRRRDRGLRGCRSARATIRRRCSLRGVHDPSGGGRDAFTVAIAHRQGERIIVDCVRAWTPPFNPSGVVEEAAALLKSYRCREVTGDRYAGEWPRESFRSHSIEYIVADLDRSALYLELLPAVNAGTVELPDDDKLLRELRGLERRRGSAGRDRVEHRPGEHDDRANAVAGVTNLLASADEEPRMVAPPRGFCCHGRRQLRPEPTVARRPLRGFGERLVFPTELQAVGQMMEPLEAPAPT